MSDTTRTDTPPSADQPSPGPAAEPEGDVTSWVRRAAVAAVVVVLGVWVSLPTLAIIAALVFMIFMHELGHYITAKAAGMKVTEFFLGFGPRLWSFRRGETEYGVKAIPAGAYVRIIGMSNLEEVDPSEEDRTYRQKPYWRRLSVAVAGSTMHFLMAIALFFGMVSVLGQTDFTAPSWTVASVTPGSAAEAADVQPGDRVIGIDGQRFENFQALSAEIRQRAGDSVSLLVLRDGRELTLETTIGPIGGGEGDAGFLGVEADLPTVRVGPVTGVVDAVQATGETIWLSIKGLGAFFSPDGLSGYFEILTGSDPAPEPGEVEDEGRIISVVGAVQLASQSPDIAGVLYFLFAVNVFIGVFNLVPLLPFDGGHVAIATYERLRSRKGKRHFADVAKLMPVTYAVVALLAFVFISSLYLDIVDPISL